MVRADRRWLVPVPAVPAAPRAGRRARAAVGLLRLEEESWPPLRGEPGGGALPVNYNILNSDCESDFQMIPCAPYTWSLYLLYL